METRKKKKTPSVTSGDWPKIMQGTHLTIKKFEDGHTELVWDDEQLLKEVREAIASIEQKPKKKSKQLNSVEVSIEAIEKAKTSSKKAVATKTPAKKTVAKKKTK